MEIKPTSNNDSKKIQSLYHLVHNREISELSLKIIEKYISCFPHISYVDIIIGSRIFNIKSILTVDDITNIVLKNQIIRVQEPDHPFTIHQIQENLKDPKNLSVNLFSSSTKKIPDYLLKLQEQRLNIYALFIFETPFTYLYRDFDMGLFIIPYIMKNLNQIQNNFENSRKCKQIISTYRHQIKN